MNQKQQLLLLFCGIGTVAFTLGFYLLCRLLRYRAFSTVDGAVVASSVATLQDENATWYLPQITYTYTVKGRSFTSETWHSLKKLDAPRYGSRKKAEKVRARYAAKNPLHVYYDPANPAAAFLFNGPTIHAYGLFIIGTAFWIFGWLYYMGGS